ncbi:MAG: ATP-dependent protease, Lon family [Thermoanaerobacteraceae bacterium]|uniref:Lon family ATP-dependent protease n=1 Tax=Thermanaeromonas sp. C210 TaxID=2731925 RepID=UPI00155CDD7C|nr:Lon family ATP-dependent protease [Thermanaeromonas sp. C210]MBE3580263.1 ATP-dependent protease, Lon family [Thermoanaerobacteraceae bacterium]GFN22903.1 ATP-dependent protease, Lon family protein [Thermanaeromonas sp. C210]
MPRRAKVALFKDEGDFLSRQVSALYGILADIYGTDKLVLKASKLEALDYLQSDKLSERVLALQKLVYEDPTIDTAPPLEAIPQILNEIQEELADFIARRSVEDNLERRVAERMQERHEEYLQEIRMQILRENAGPENAHTLKKLAILEKMEQTRLARSAMEVLRPQSLEEIVGQERAVRSLLAKLVSPFPQHILIYGPPGVGKTTAARLALEEAKKIKGSPFKADAPFIEVNGATLRWDPREVTNPLLGSVHDPIYQGARRDLAESGVPEPKLGLVTEAHGGVLFIDEIGEMDPLLLNKLLKVLEDKRVTFDSSYYDPADENVPQYIRKLFEEGAPADFVLIGATTCDPEELSPALRSRCAEVYFEPLTPAQIETIVREAAARLGVKLEPAVPSLIAEYTIEGRKAVSLLADAYGLALYQQYQKRGRRRRLITVQHILEVAQTARLTPFITARAQDEPEIGRVFGLAVAGFVGSVLEVEAVAFPAREPGKGNIRFNETAGSMARDSVFNAAAVFRLLTGEDLSDYDVHVNVVGGGNIDGPSAGLAVCAAIISAIQGRAVRQDVAVTGEISIQGKVKPVGGIVEKIYGARQAGMRYVILPEANAAEVPGDLPGIQVIPVATVAQALEHLLVKE